MSARSSAGSITSRTGCGTSPTARMPRCSRRRRDDGGIDRLFRTLVPVVTGRRSSAEIVARLRRKWELGHDLLDKLGRVREQVRSLANLHGAPALVLDRLTRDFEAWAPDSVASLRSLFESLEHHGVATESISLDLGLGRGIGFYSQMIFDLTATTATGRSNWAAAGDTTAWLASWEATATTGAWASPSAWNGSTRSSGLKPRSPGETRFRFPGRSWSFPRRARPSRPRSGWLPRSARGRARDPRIGLAPDDLADRARALLARWSVVVHHRRSARPGLISTITRNPTRSDTGRRKSTRLIADQIREVDG